MIPYLAIEKKESSSLCSSDFAVLYQGELVFVSLLDEDARVKEAVSTLIYNNGSIELKNRENFMFTRKIDNYSIDNKYNYKTERLDGGLSHGIVIHNEQDFVYDWENVGLEKVLSEHLREKHYIPVTEEVIGKVFGNLDEDSLIDIVEECEVYSNNDEMKNARVWKFKSVDRFKKALGKVSFQKTKESKNFDWDKIEDISDYLVTFADSIKEKLDENITILHDKNNVNQRIFDGEVKPFSGQIPVTDGGVKTLQDKGNRFLYLASEQGTGKTIMSTKTNHVYHLEKKKMNYTTLVVVPSITLRQWEKEIKKVIGSNVNVQAIKSTSDFIQIYNKTSLLFDKPTYFLVGKETFKLSYKMIHGVNFVDRIVDVEIEDGEIEKQKMEVCTCPDCGEVLKNPLRKSDYAYLTRDDFKTMKKSNQKCWNCNSPLWQATYDKNKKTSVIDFIKRNNIKFDSVMVDEVHEANNFDSIIGSSTREALKRGKKSILLSATVTNGYASSIYNVLFALMPRTLQQDGVLSKDDFVKRYGTLETITKNKGNKPEIEIKDSITGKSYKEVEGINPLVFTKYLANNFIFTELKEIRDDLPTLTENYVAIEHNEEVSQNENRLLESIKSASPFNYSFYNDSVIKHYTNNPFNWNSIEIGQEEVVKVKPKNIEDTILPKEKELINICKKENEDGRKTWVYVDYVSNGQYTQGEPLIDRLQRVLEENGLKVFVLKSDTKTIDRKDIIEANKDKYDVFISNPKLISVGVNMQWCPNYVFYSPTYHVNTVRQAMMRGLRADSTMDNKVFHLHYDNGVELEIMNRYKLKLAESESLESKFNEIDVERTVSGLGAKIQKELELVI